MTSLNSKNTANNQEGIGHYHQHILETKETIITDHFMHAQNLSDYQLFDSQQFYEKAIFVKPEDIRNILFPALRKASAEIIEQRTAAARARARAYYKIYQLKDENSVGFSEEITEILLDKRFQKSKISPADRVNYRDNIDQLIKNNKSIKLIIPNLPHKVGSPLKATGIFPCLAEANLLLRLSEIPAIINNIYSHYFPHDKLHPFAQFIVVSDGYRFNINVPNSVIDAYQKNLQWWLKELRIDQLVQIEDYKKVVDNWLVQSQKEQRDDYYRKALHLIQTTLADILDPFDVKQSLEKAVALDPYPEQAHPENRFVPLFKSLMYTVYYKELGVDFGKDRSAFDKYAKIYREMTRHLFTPFVQEDKKEQLRQSMLLQAWNAAIDYLATVVADRDLDENLLSKAIPNSIRYTVHAKPGQIALHGGRSPVWPWNGTAQLIPINQNVKFSNATTLNLEGIGAHPVLITDEGNPSSSDEDLLYQFSQSYQPLFYVHPDLNCKDPQALLNVLSSLTRNQ